MKHTPSPDIDAIAGRIQACLESSGRLTETVMDYIASTLFAPEPGTLAAFLADESDGDRDTLLDLVFSPDETVQVALEPMLEAARLTTAEEAALRDRLADRAIRAPLITPDGRRVTRIVVPDFIAVQYLERLNVTWQIDPSVSAAIAAGPAANRAPVVKVRLRNADVHPDAAQKALLCRFFARMPDADGGYLASLDLVVALLETFAGAGDAYDVLADRKRALFRALEQVNRFETLLRRSNMETLMLQGIRPPQGSRQDLSAQMHRIDSICYHLFGKMEVIAAPLEESAPQVTDLKSPAQAVKSLLR